MQNHKGHKVKIRFILNYGELITTDDFIEAVLPALWNKDDSEEFLKNADEIVNKIKAGEIFFFPYAIDEYKTRLLINLQIGYQIFDWDTKEEDIHHICEHCRDIENVTNNESAILEHDSVKIFLCPKCKSIIFDDLIGYHGHGSRGYLTEKELRDVYGITAQILHTP